MNFFDVIETKAGTGRCIVRFCRGKCGKSNGRFCRRCRDRRYKALRPHAYALNKLRSNARQRGKEFTITHEEWVDWCSKHGFLDKAGKGAGDLTVDRRDHTQGYHIWNIQPLTNSANATKGNYERNRAHEPVDEEQPF